MPTPLKDRYPQVYLKDRKALRAWLAKNHDKSSGIWLIYYKKGSGTQRLDYNDAVEEALCYGWIDSLMQPLDDERYLQLFTPRKPKSRWSKTNKERVERLVNSGLMTPIGMAKIEAARKDGSWAQLDHVDKLELPPDLKKAMKGKKDAEKNFRAFTPGKQKQLLYWLNDAKREETRAKRIAVIVKAAVSKKFPFD